MTKEPKLQVNINLKILVLGPFCLSQMQYEI